MTFLDKELREQTLFELFQSNAESELIESLKLALDKVNTRILKTNGEWTKNKQQKIFDKIAAEINPLYDKYKTKLPNEVKGIATVISDAYIGNDLPINTLENIIDTDRIVQGYQIKDLFKATKDNHVRQLKREIASGIAAGKNPNTIVNNVMKRNSKLTKGQLKTATRTYVSESRAMARHESFKQMEKDGLIEGYEYVATLDSRTSEYCRNHDGQKLYKSINQISHLINVHFNCRSVFVPISETENQMRASQFGQVKDIKYSDWFETQDENFKRTVLGAKKFSLYKKGKYKIETIKDLGNVALTISAIKPLLMSEEIILTQEQLKQQENIQENNE